jgi:hypothetical protein
VGSGRVRPSPPPAAQGFGPDTTLGAVEPPSRADLLGSVARSAGDLVHVGLDLGRVLLRSFVGRLPGA